MELSKDYLTRDGDVLEPSTGAYLYLLTSCLWRVRLAGQFYSYDSSFTGRTRSASGGRLAQSL
ncbi:uncharacterized protein LAESUDRAFT_730942 [Laetiporus sulphureus 93-53]|uniref:Uncharacterized protein n=1 Tax=Laetiporus sulphureus 93-53 TaxID=1314785 RepID=A0A165BUF7_9APHY|nr:uncharacterized protein LAESUDRAFT_730942 [Laetiporus sulphureus 93-53]KZT01671.1 hypothetical protein LAESUDRAFT_730942 [Laetiporus sulphureus 93-53]